MENLGRKSREFVAWLEQLKQVTADKIYCEPDEVKINIEAAYPYFKDGYTPTQCFREEYIAL